MQRVVDECAVTYIQEQRAGVQSAIRSMIAPVCDILNWLFNDDDQFGTKTGPVREEYKDVTAQPRAGVNAERVCCAADDYEL